MLFHGFVCSETNHKVYACPVFLSLFSKARWQTVKSNNRCFSFLGNYESIAYKFETTCFKFHKRHQTTLNFETNVSPHDYQHSTSSLKPR